MAGAFNIPSADVFEDSRDVIDFGHARCPKGDSIFVRRVPGRLSHPEELGWSVALRIVLQPAGNVHVFRKA